MAKKKLEERKTLTLGDMLISTDKKTGDYEKDENGNPQKFHLKVFLPEGIEQVTLKSGDYMNFRVVADEDVERMPDWKKPLVQLRAWISNPFYKG